MTNEVYIQRSQASKVEVVEYCAPHHWNYRKRFRHYVLETNRSNAKNGVAHRQYTTAKVSVIDGTVTVVSGQWKGHQLIGTRFTMGDTTWIGDIRIEGLG